jgi:hypothetical protein
LLSDPARLVRFGSTVAHIRRLGTVRRQDELAAACSLFIMGDTFDNHWDMFWIFHAFW